MLEYVGEQHTSGLAALELLAGLAQLQIEDISERAGV